MPVNACPVAAAIRAAVSRARCSGLLFMQRIGRSLAANQLPSRSACATPLATSGMSVAAPMRRASALLPNVLPWRMMKMRRVMAAGVSGHHGWR